MQYSADPPLVEEIILVMRQAGHDRHGLRIRALIAILWRGGANERRPDGSGLRQVFCADDAVGYWDSETQPDLT